MAKHWSERLSCGLCGKTFRSAIAEARHRHNAPMLCRPAMSATMIGKGFSTMAKDTSGNAWAHSETIKEGDRVKADGGFPCITKGAELTVKRDSQYGDGLSGLYIDCTCDETNTPQKHFLQGQADESGALVGLYKVFAAILVACCSWFTDSLFGLMAALAT